MASSLGTKGVVCRKFKAIGATMRYSKREGIILFQFFFG